LLVPKIDLSFFGGPVYEGTHTTVGCILVAHIDRHKNIKYKIEMQQDNSLLYLSVRNHDRNITLVVITNQHTQTLFYVVCSTSQEYTHLHNLIT
jgi:hypothetical protein